MWKETGKGVEGIESEGIQGPGGKAAAGTSGMKRGGVVEGLGR